MPEGPPHPNQQQRQNRGRLPHNAEAEASVLGGILLRNEKITEVEPMLGEDDFYLAGHRAVYRAMLKLNSDGKPIDVVTLEHQLRSTDDINLIGGMEGLGKLADRYASTHNILHHAQLVRDAATVRQLVVAGEEIAEEGRDDVGDVGEFVDRVERKVLAIHPRGKTSEFKSVHGVLPEVFHKITERAKYKDMVSGVSTSFFKLDDMTGGMQPGDLIVLAARPSMGKTALALNLAQSACITDVKHLSQPEAERPPKFPVLFFSLEMGAEQLVERILCSEARMDAGKLRSGNVLEHEFHQLIRAADRMSTAPLYIDDSAALSIREIRNRARRFRQDKSIFPDEKMADGRHPLGMIVVDYIQLCTGSPEKAKEGRVAEIGEISRGLKEVARELKLPVLALSQLNRGVDARTDKRPMMSDLRESGAIEQDADVIMFIFREERYLTAESTEEKRRALEGKAEVIIGKQRNGPTGTVHLNFIGKHTRFENPAPEG